MQPLAVQLRLFTEIGNAALRLNPGRGLMARVMVADGSGRGVINIAGAVIEAELPRHVRPGEQVRLVVRHLDAQRVVLELDHSDPAPSAAHAPGLPAQPPPVAVPLPGEGRLSVPEDAPQRERRSDPHSGAQTVAVRFDGPALGALDLHFELAPGGLRVTVTAAPGPALALATAHAGELRDALGQSGDRPVSVTVVPRRQPLDVYA